jgi:hypothetical protein
MGNSNQGGRAFRGRRPDLEYFDKLPPTARTALANAFFDWASGAFFNRWKRGAAGYKTGADTAKRVAEWDAHTITKERSE